MVNGYGRQIYESAVSDCSKILKIAPSSLGISPASAVNSENPMQLTQFLKNGTQGRRKRKFQSS